LNPFYAGAYDRRAGLKGITGDYKGAIRDFNMAIKINPQNPNLYYRRGGIKGELGNIKGMCLDLKKASSLDNQDAINLLLKLKPTGACQ